MNLHRSDKVPDWEKDLDGDQPRYVKFSQSIARSTKGVVTPGNVASTIGLGLNISGAIDIKNGRILRGTVKTITGKGFDLVDGVLADKTKTKSPLGEKVDATFDKIGLLATTLALSKTNIIPKQRLSFFAIQNTANVYSTLLAKHNNVELHSSKHGKVTWAMQGISVGASLVGANIDDQKNPYLSNTIDRIAGVTAMASNVLGTLVSLDYLQTAKNVEPQKPVETELVYY